MNPPIWQEARNAEGRAYYYNVQTKATQWQKPAELMTPVERALANQPWKEYAAEGGRKYWSNTETKQSTWEMPDVYKDALEQAQAAPAPPSCVWGGSSYPQAPHRERERERDRDYRDRDRDRDHRDRDRDDYDRGYNDRRGGYGSYESNGMVAAPALVTQSEPDYGSVEEAESAFMKMLKRHNVQPDWTWEQTMRVVIKDPQYRSLKDPRDRKAAFEKYAVEVRMQEKDRAKERFAKLRADFNTMLKRHPEIKHYSRWKTIRPIIEGETTFRATNEENERRQLFEEYVVELKKTHMEQEATARKEAMSELAGILGSLNLEPYTRWAEAQAVIESNEKVQADDKFKTLSKYDILTAFENHIKTLEREFNDARQQQKAIRARKERRNREKYLELLKEVRSQGKIKAGSKWMDIRPLFQDDARYQGILGQAGSTPLDLFWDMLEEEERSLRGPRNDVLDVLDDKRFEVTSSTPYEDFSAIMTADRRTSKIDADILQLIFQRIQEKAIRRDEDEKHAADRHQRRAVDALRSRIKRLEPPVRVSDTWEETKPRLEKYEEYKALESDELRESAFEKYIRRLKERDEDTDRDREMRDRDRSRRDGDRGDRDYRSGRGERRGGSRASRTPELDVYEAERRKAQADRERSYRKVSGFSPSRDRRDDRERGDRYRDRDDDRERDREFGRPPRRDGDRRESERERLYRTRGDPRGGRDELDYGGGESRSTGSVRRRRESDSESVASRSVKRYRRDSRERDRSKGRTERREQSAIPEEDIKKEKAVHSGSEEGEIEED
ncbi:Formin binding protein (FNB3) [Penicillium manginii]|uniref:Formin binding protein (FNB3) n=1 Tax=Penicillium manginii TaxID=203109 RepID=UPI002548E0B6|nr:Formin binding protein (FNB3) [Penicillium manginii]KAJ5741489.1 Formin binding protein (FNB3) [Penicillium manginii]